MRPDQATDTTRLNLSVKNSAKPSTSGQTLLEELPPLGPQYPRGIRATQLLLEWGGTAPEQAIGSFASVSGDPQAQQSATRRARGALIVVSNNTDPGRDAEFADWYDHTHLPDVVASGGYHSAARYLGQLACGGPPRSLALYLTDDDPLEAHRRVQAAFGAMTMWPAIAVHHVRDYLIRTDPEARQ